MRPAEIIHAWIKVRRRIFANDPMAWPLVGFAFLIWSTLSKPGPSLSNSHRGMIRKKRRFLAVDARTVLLDKKTPAEEVLGAALNPA